jgi:hypothetical protein
MDEVINQAPSHISKEDIEIIFKKNNDNVIDTLIDLWNIDTPKSVNPDDDSDNLELDLKKPENKWANIRNVCDSYDKEMQAQLSKLKIKGK